MPKSPERRSERLLPCERPGPRSSPSACSPAALCWSCAKRPDIAQAIRETEQGAVEREREKRRGLVEALKPFAEVGRYCREGSILKGADARLWSPSANFPPEPPYISVKHVLAAEAALTVEMTEAPASETRGGDDLKCPKCGAKAVRRLAFACTVCECRFEPAFGVKDALGAEPHEEEQR